MRNRKGKVSFLKNSDYFNDNLYYKYTFVKLIDPTPLLTLILDL